MKISDMIIVITGANGALGSVLMDYFSNHAAFVVGTVRNLSKNANNSRSSIIEMDPLDHHSINSAILAINDLVGDIHVWMNIAGGFSMGSHVEKGLDEWNYMYNTNFMTALNCCQKILPKMKGSGWGRIINMGAQSAINGIPLAGPYCSSKSSIHMLTKIISLENGGNITCNAILPGIINTKNNQKILPDADRSGWVSPNQIAIQIAKLIQSKDNGRLIHL